MYWLENACCIQVDTLACNRPAAGCTIGIEADAALQPELKEIASISDAFRSRCRRETLSGVAAPSAIPAAATLARRGS
jgi:hypothetical protein